MSTHVQSIRATGLHGKFNLQQDFQSGVNILYGKNGSGKTTLLHILANCLNADYPRFALLQFDSIDVNLSDGTHIALRRQGMGDKASIIPSINGALLQRISVGDPAGLQERNRNLSSTEAELLLHEHQEQQLQAQLAILKSEEQMLLVEQQDLLQHEQTLKKVDGASRDKEQLTRLDQQRMHLQSRLDLVKKQLDELKEHASPKPQLPSAYFPAFRTMIEAWTSVREDSSANEDRAYRNLVAHGSSSSSIGDLARLRKYASRSGNDRATLFARDLFGSFVPTINYPSPREIEERLTDEVRQAQLAASRVDQELFSKAFVGIFAALKGTRSTTKDDPETILKQIEALFRRIDAASFQDLSQTGSGTYQNLRREASSFSLQEGQEQVAVGILDLYKKTLQEKAKVQENSARGVKQYLHAVNDFLEGKDLEVEIGTTDARSFRPSVVIRYENGTSSPLQALSSGERQIVTLIYAATQLSSRAVVLIDEPEISLHVDWQRPLLKKMAGQLADRQIIACTHSPEIGADYEDRVTMLNLVPMAH